MQQSLNIYIFTYLLCDTTRNVVSILRDFKFSGRLPRPVSIHGSLNISSVECLVDVSPILQY